MATTGPSRVPFIKPGLGTRLGEALRGTAGQDTSWALESPSEAGVPLGPQQHKCWPSVYVFIT